MDEQRVDPFLEYYCKLTQSNYLHYGYWNLNDDLTVENLRRAQERYINYLIDFIPSHVQTILDVGCGIGGNALQLTQAGFNVEALSPDPFQKQRFIAKGIPFHLIKFENFETSQKYDLILMSESSQYIPIREGFEKCCRLLKEKGYLLVSDYFLKQKLEEGNVFAACTHQKNEYLEVAREFGFEAIATENITSRVMPTLDLAKLKYEEYVEPTLELLSRLLRRRLPLPYKILQFLAKSQLQEALRQLQLIDSQLFLKYRQYMIYLFERQ